MEPTVAIVITVMSVYSVSSSFLALVQDAPETTTTGRTSATVPPGFVLT